MALGLRFGRCPRRRRHRGRTRGSRRHGGAHRARRQSARRERGHGLPRPAREPAAPAHRRAARGRAGPDRHAAQRRREGEPVFPARVQSRSRHGFLEPRRGHGRQPADPWPRPGIHGPQLRDPGAGRARRLSEGDVLPGAREFLRGGRGGVSLRGPDRPVDLADGRRGQLSARSRRRVDWRSRAATCWSRWNTPPPTGRGICRRT